ncbi:protein obstructor-E-like [Ceratina calcarata]|uniref:Protein obstructor-E-like n=1 Tax=Ceratina calcarata TaxID=156304 RepID=A0AAJ7JI69_9HYME|nr:protein obstructor-E-like [Ceratina calcarata]
MIEHRKSMTLLALAALLASVEAGTPLLGAPPCPDGFGVHTYPHPQECNSFFLCENGTLTLEYCENGLLYDGRGSVHNHCNYYWAVNCEDRKAELIPISHPGCEFAFGLYPSSDECSTHYIKCTFGYPAEEQCDAGLVYDEKSHTCVWPDQLIPLCNPEEVVGFKCPKKIPKNSPAAKFWPYPRFPVPGDCGRLITCVNGQPRLLTCGDHKLFDSVTLTCLDSKELPHCAK